ncbi:MAG: restriction endonuclease subunit S [Bacilli bacterium]|nr:restriction endonuclease subunit S [Bacilli bacterium]
MMINVQNIKRKVIDLAIRGELSKHLDSDGDAIELLTLIKNRKKELLLSGILKKDKELKPIDDEEIPFDIPSSWKWVRLGEYAQKVTDQVASGSFADIRDNVVSLKEPSYALMVKTADFNNGFTKNLTYTNQHGYEFLENSNLFGGELILSNIGSIGKVFIVPKLNMKMTLAPNSIMVRLIDNSLIMYLYYFLLSSQGYKELDSISTGIAMKKFNKGGLKTILIPVPPLEEQKRIVAKLDVIFAELDKIDEKQTRLSKIQEKMEAKILKLAIQGKLVEQRTEEGTGEELFRLIQQEKQELIKQGKIKKEKPLPAIEDDEIPFEIPSTWKWVKFGQLISLTSGVDLEPKEYYPEPKDKSIPYITGASCVDDKGKLIINRFTDITQKNSSIGDLLLTCKGTIGKISINDKGDIHLARQLMGIKTFINSDFTKYYLMFIVEELKTKANGLIPGIDRPTVLNYYFPLPPFEEQKRIVAKIEELLPLCRGN